MEPLTFEAIGTTWWIELFNEEDMKIRDVLLRDIADFLTPFETRYSRFRDTSLIYKLNTTGVITQPDADGVAFLELGRDLYNRTGGLFNPLVGSALEARGYDATYSFKPTLEPSLGNPNTDLIITSEVITLTAGKWDVGGYGKGYAIDMVAAILRKHGITDFLINGGGDMYGTSQNGEPITVYLEHPTEADTYLGVAHIMNQGFAASSPHKRAWTVAGTTYNHIVGNSTHSDASFVVAENALTADVFATIALITDEINLTRLASKEQFSFLRFHLNTESLEGSDDFPFIPLE